MQGNICGDWTDLIATRKFPSEDWRGFNRISVWIYPDIDGAPAISASLVLHNEGAHILAPADRFALQCCHHLSSPDATITSSGGSGAPRSKSPRPHEHKRAAILLLFKF